MFFLKNEKTNAAELEIVRKRQKVEDKKFYEQEISKMIKNHLEEIMSLKQYYDMKIKEINTSKIQKYEDRISIRDKGIERLRQEIKSVNKRLRRYEKAYMSTNALRNYLIETIIKFEQSVANIKSYSSHIIQEFHTVHDMIEFHEQQANKVHEKMEDIYFK